MDIDKNELEELCSKYKIKYVILADRIRLTSLCNEWFITEDDTYDKKYQLYHINKKKQKGIKPYHFQHRFYDIPFLLESVYTHDKYKVFDRWDTRNTHMGRLFAQIEAQL